MSRGGAVLLSAVLLVAGTVSAQAISLTTGGTEDVVVEIDEGGMSQSVVIGANQTAIDVCLSACTITLPSGESMDFEGYETVAIEGGKFVVLE